MLFLLSPAKKLDYDSVLSSTAHTQPLFVTESEGLIDVLRTQSVEDVANLMKLSPALAQLNVDRYQQWSPSFSLDNARPAILAFNGDVYEGLQAQDLSEKDLQWAQQHVAILSGLYGVLRPLDLMQPYRLEMGTRLENSRGKNLYDYWKGVVAPYLNQQFEADKSRVIVNLASEEYFKAVDLKALQARVIQCVFQDQKAGQWKIISFYAKRARGLMARFAITNQIDEPEKLTDFNLEGYAYCQEQSTPDKLVFRRPEHWSA